MALAIDASTPVRVNTATATATTATFTPPAGSLLVAATSMNTSSSGSGTVSIANTGSALTWTLQKLANKSNGGQPGAATIHTASAASGAITVTATTTNNLAGTLITSLKVYVLTGAATTNPVGGSNSGGSTTNNLTTTAFTSTGTASLAVFAATEWNALGAASSSDLTADVVVASGDSIDGLSGYKTIAASGSSVTANLDAAGTGAAAWSWCGVEILAAAGSAGRFLPFFL